MKSVVIAMVIALFGVTTAIQANEPTAAAPAEAPAAGHKEAKKAKKAKKEHKEEHKTTEEHKSETTEAAPAGH